MTRQARQLQPVVRAIAARAAAPAVKERPILFSADMVRAILAGRKTQTRRVVKPQPEHRGECGYALSGVPAWYWASPRYDNGDGVHYFHTDEEAAKRLMIMACPFGARGDRLWVRETWGLSAHQVTLYRASGDQVQDVERSEGGWSRGPRWRPSIHMFRRLSRITLEITEVRAERLMDCSPADAIAEGLLPSGALWVGAPTKHSRSPKLYTHPGAAFASRWDALNAKRGFGWATNPFVWVLTFRVAEVRA